MNIKEQQRGLEFEEFVRRFLHEVGYTQIEEQPEIGIGKADFFVGDREKGGFFVEAKSPNLKKWTALDEDHLARVQRFESTIERYVKESYETLYQKCILVGNWNGFLGLEVTLEEVKRHLGPIKDWVGKEQELLTTWELNKWHGWLGRYESLKTYLRNNPALDRDVVALLKSQLPFYDEIRPYPFGCISVLLKKPKQGNPQEWRCTWRLVQRDRYHPVESGFTFLGGGGSGGSSHRLEPTVKNAVREYKKKLKSLAEMETQLERVPLVIFIDGRTADRALGKDDLDLAFAEGVWKDLPPKTYPEVPLGVVVLGLPMYDRSQSEGDIIGDFIINPYWGKSFPFVLSPLLQTFRLRDWSVGKILRPMHKG